MADHPAHCNRGCPPGGAALLHLLPPHPQRETGLQAHRYRAAGAASGGWRSKESSFLFYSMVI